mmetsp:Transcript_34065/g.45549  ORF Transcript_34065/g.45549 Transcript_34065/m.45549 type:complete len:89 (-) Transcript_34065:219-485(-)
MKNKNMHCLACIYLFACIHTYTNTTQVLYHPPTNRSNIVRSIVVADIPLCSTSNNTSWMKKAQESVVHTLQQAVAEGTFLSAAANRQK